MDIEYTYKTGIINFPISFSSNDLRKYSFIPCHITSTTSDLSSTFGTSQIGCVKYYMEGKLRVSLVDKVGNFNTSSWAFNIIMIGY